MEIRVLQTVRVHEDSREEIEGQNFEIAKNTKKEYEEVIINHVFPDQKRGNN